MRQTFTHVEDVRVPLGGSDSWRQFVLREVGTDVSVPRDNRKVQAVVEVVPEWFLVRDLRGPADVVIDRIDLAHGPAGAIAFIDVEALSLLLDLSIRH